MAQLTSEEMMIDFFTEWRNRDAQRTVLADMDDQTLANLVVIANDVAASVLAEHDRRRVQDVITPKSTVYPT